MARLYLIRHGTGDARVASSFEVLADDVKTFYGNARVHSTASLPTINAADGPANGFAGPHITVVELLKGEVAFGDFLSPGFNVLLDVDPLDAHANLVKHVS